MCAFRGHVQSVYQVAWSGDSRLLCSSSKDSTMKVWDIRTKKMKFDLPGHADEVYAVSELSIQSVGEYIQVFLLDTRAYACFSSSSSARHMQVDWAPNGERVASGGKDKVVKMWQA